MFATYAETASAHVRASCGPQSSNDLVRTDKLAEREEPRKRGRGNRLDLDARRKRPHSACDRTAGGSCWLERLRGDFRGRALQAKQCRDSGGTALDDDRSIPDEWSLAKQRARHGNHFAKAQRFPEGLGNGASGGNNMRRQISGDATF